MRDADKSPLFSAVATASNNSYIGSPKSGPLADMMRRDLAMQIARAIVESGHLQVVEEEFSTIFRLEVMVMSPDALHREAKKIADRSQGFGKPYYITEAR